MTLEIRQKILFATTGCVLWVLLLPTLIIFYLPLFVYKYFIVYPLMQLFRSESSFVSPNDSAVTLLNYDFKRRPFITLQAFLLEENVSLENVREHFKECFLKESLYGGGRFELFFYIFSNFLGYIIKGKKDYKDYSFDEHFSLVYFEDILVDIGEDISQLESLSSDKLNDVLAQYFLNDKEYFEISQSEPLWDVFVINSKLSKHKTVVVYRYDHLLKDAFSLFFIGAKLMNSPVNYVQNDNFMEMHEKVSFLN